MPVTSTIQRGVGNSNEWNTSLQRSRSYNTTPQSSHNQHIKKDMGYALHLKQRKEMLFGNKEKQKILQQLSTDEEQTVLNFHEQTPLKCLKQTKLNRTLYPNSIISQTNQNRVNTTKYFKSTARSGLLTNHFREKLLTLKDRLEEEIPEELDLLKGCDLSALLRKKPLQETIERNTCITEKIVSLKHQNSQLHLKEGSNLNRRLERLKSEQNGALSFLNYRNLELKKFDTISSRLISLRKRLNSRSLTQRLEEAIQRIPTDCLGELPKKNSSTKKSVMFAEVPQVFCF